MNINDIEKSKENEWLEKVIKETQKQLDEERELEEGIKRDGIETQRELWNDMGSVSISNGLDQVVEFMSYINTMKIQKRSYDFAKKVKEKYERMLLSPYFGRMDFHENGDEKAEKFYIGMSNLINDKYEFLIYDWRAPVSSMFYDYEIGDAGYECLEGKVEGQLTLKRQYKVNGDKIEYMFDSNITIDDEMLQGILGKSTDNKMNAIVTTIQKEQNKVIRNEGYKTLIVQGPAGSGKTSVALHRIAYLLYKHRDKIKPENIVIFSPNDIFNDYISTVLPQLGEDNMYQTTFKEYMHKSLGTNFIKENNCDMMEYILGAKNQKNYQRRINSIKFKSSMEFIGVLKEYVSHLDQKGKGFKDIILNGNVIIPSKDIEELFFKDYAKFPLIKRLKKMRERMLFILKPYEKQRIREVTENLRSSGYYVEESEIAARSASIVRDELREIYYDINKMTEFHLIGAYKEIFRNLEFYLRKTNAKYNEKDINDIRKYTLKSLDSGKFNYEDQSPLLYLKGAFGDMPKTSDIKYVIIDEAQDYSPLQYEIFHQLFKSSNMTILGDLHQSINPFMNVGDYSNISGIFPRENTCIINLTKSYRSTMEITSFARNILNKKTTDECVERRGDKPLLLGFKNEDRIKERLLEDIKIYKEKGYKSIGIITRTIKEAQEVEGFLKDKVHVKTIIKDDDEFANDTVVIPSFLAKGLEFDVVLIYNVGEGNYRGDEERLLLYTACTRALHVLCLYYTGESTPLLKENH